MRTLLFIGIVITVTTVSAQVDVLNILNRDSFAPNVQKVTEDCYLRPAGEDTNIFQSSRYYECDSVGRWKVRIESFSDDDASHDSVKYDPNTRTRIISRSNDFEPSKGITVFNKDGTIKSFLAVPGYREPQLTEYEYDQNKRLIKKTLTFVEFKSVEEYLYDKEGRIVNLKKSSGSVTQKKLQLDYEEKYEYSNNTASMMYAFHYGANNQVRVRDTIVCTYDDEHRMTSKVEVMENGTSKKITTFEYDSQGRLIAAQWQLIAKGDTKGNAGNKNIEYDSLGYYALYVEEEIGYGFTNRWTTQYNELGLPVQCYYETVGETFYYEWKYQYR
jgi:YD repeat-containing protein